MKILHLYPKEMNLYSDVGNALCLKYRLENIGYKTEIIPCSVGDRIPDFDIMLIGGGQDKEMSILRKDILRKADSIKYHIENNKVVLAICGGYQLLGQYFKTSDNKTIEMTGILPFYTLSTGKRAVGNIVFDTPFGKAVGFENHSGKTFLREDLEPLGQVITGCGNNGRDKTEGLLYKNTFCTYAHGPFLPKNPNVADQLISRCLNVDLPLDIDNKLEKKCQSYLISRFS